MSYATGVATNTDEKVPITIPNISAKIKPRITSPPNRKIANSTTKVVPAVLTVRANVLLIALWMFSRPLRCG